MATANNETAEGKAADHFHISVNRETIVWTTDRFEGSGTGSCDQTGSGSLGCPPLEIGARGGTFTVQMTDTVTEIILFASSVPVFEYKGPELPSIRGSWKGTWKVRNVVESESV